METGLPFQTQERIKRTKGIYHFSNNSLETQFTGAVFIATCLHHIFLKFIIRSQSLSKYTKTTQPKPPNKTIKTPPSQKNKQKKPPKKQRPYNQLTAVLNSGDKSSWSTPEGMGTVLRQKARMDKRWVLRERAVLGSGLLPHISGHCSTPHRQSQPHWPQQEPEQKEPCNSVSSELRRPIVVNPDCFNSSTNHLKLQGEQPFQLFFMTYHKLTLL